MIGEAKKTVKENKGIKEADDIKLETFNEGALSSDDAYWSLFRGGTYCPEAA